MAEVIVPTDLLVLTEGQRRVEVAADDLLVALERLDERFPGFTAKLETGHSVVVDGTLHAVVSAVPLNPDSEVRFVPMVAGG